MQHTPAPAATPSFYLKRHAQVVQALVLAGAALLVAQPVLLLTASDWLEIFGLGSFLGLPNLPADAAGRWRTALVSLLPVGGGLYALLHLWRLFGEYGRGRVFGATAQDALVRFAWAVLLLSLCAYTRTYNPCPRPGDVALGSKRRATSANPPRSSAIDTLSARPAGAANIFNGGCWSTTPPTTSPP